MNKARFRVTDETGEYTTIHLYKESDTHYHFFRGLFPYDEFGPAQHLIDTPKLPRLYKCQSLYPYQMDAVEQLLFNFTQYYEQTFKAPCGAGKTRMALEVIRRMALKTLIVVPTKPLMRQWCQNIEGVLGYVPGQFWASKKQLDKDIVVAVTPSVMRASDKFKDFKLAILDEGHRLGADTWSGALGNTFGYRLNLTATPKRRDRRDKVFHGHCGPVRVEISTKYLQEIGAVLRPKVVFLRHPKDYNLSGYGQRNGQLSRLLSQMGKDKGRITFIQGVLEKNIAKGHKGIVISKRLETLNELHKRLKIPAALVTSEFSDTYPDFSGYDVLLGIESLVKEGLDKADLSLLIGATPMLDPGMWEQAAGRISRPYPGKLDPVFVVIVDSTQPFNLILENGPNLNYLENAFLRQLEFAQNMGLDIYLAEKGTTRRFQK